MPNLAYINALSIDRFGTFGVVSLLQCEGSIILDDFLPRFIFCLLAGRPM